MGAVLLWVRDLGLQTLPLIAISASRINNIWMHLQLAWIDPSIRCGSSHEGKALALYLEVRLNSTDNVTWQRWSVLHTGLSRCVIVQVLLASAA